MQIDGFDAMLPQYGYVATKKYNEACAGVRPANKTNLVHGVPILNKAGVGNILPIMNVHSDPHVPVIMGMIKSNIELSEDWIALGIVDWPYRNYDGTASKWNWLASGYPLLSTLPVLMLELTTGLTILTELLVSENVCGIISDTVGVSGYSGYGFPDQVFGYSGYSGVSGWIGESGYSGYNSWYGVSGYSGNTGLRFYNCPIQKIPDIIPGENGNPDIQPTLLKTSNIFGPVCTIKDTATYDTDFIYSMFVDTRSGETEGNTYIQKNALFSFMQLWSNIIEKDVENNARPMMMIPTRFADKRVYVIQVLQKYASPPLTGTYYTIKIRKINGITGKVEETYEPLFPDAPSAGYNSTGNTRPIVYEFIANPDTKPPTQSRLLMVPKFSNYYEYSYADRIIAWDVASNAKAWEYKENQGVVTEDSDICTPGYWIGNIWVPPERNWNSHSAWMGFKFSGGPEIKWNIRIGCNEVADESKKVEAYVITDYQKRTLSETVGTAYRIKQSWFDKFTSDWAEIAAGIPPRAFYIGNYNNKPTNSTIHGYNEYRNFVQGKIAAIEYDTYDMKYVEKYDNGVVVLNASSGSVIIKKEASEINTSTLHIPEVPQGIPFVVWDAFSWGSCETGIDYDSLEQLIQESLTPTQSTWLDLFSTGDSWGAEPVYTGPPNYVDFYDGFTGAGGVWQYDGWWVSVYIDLKPKDVEVKTAKDIRNDYSGAVCREVIAKHVKISPDTKGSIVGTDIHNLNKKWEVSLSGYGSAVVVNYMLGHNDKFYIFYTASFQTGPQKYGVLQLNVETGQIEKDLKYDKTPVGQGGIEVMTTNSGKIVYTIGGNTYFLS